MEAGTDAPSQKGSSMIAFDGTSGCQSLPSRLDREPVSGPVQDPPQPASSLTLNADQAATLLRLLDTQRELRTATPLHALVSDCLLWREGKRSGSGTKRLTDFLKSLLTAVPAGIAVSELTQDHVFGWLASKTTWNATTKRNAITALNTLFNWGVKTKRITENPIAGIEKPKATPRRDFVRDQEHALIVLTASDQQGKDLVEMAHETGARPQELRIMAARHVDLANHRIVIPAAEAKGRVRDRVIYLSPRAEEIVRRLLQTCGTGPLLRNADGQPWTPNAIKNRMDRIKERLGLKKLRLYGYRHAFAHKMLDQKIDSLTVATLMGHVDTQMLARVYGHVDENKSLLLSALNPDGKTIEATGTPSAPSQ